jgi:hypothetical protein
MTFNRQSYNNRGGGQPFGSITAIIISLAVLVVLFFLARFVFNILYYLSPIFLIATLVIDYKVVWDYLKWVRNLYRRDIIIGIGATILSIFGFPILSAFLFGKALFRKRVKDAAKQAKEYHEGKLIEYEEVEDEPLDLKRLEEQTRRREQEKSSRPSSRDDSSDEYEDLFE